MTTLYPRATPEGVEIVAEPDDVGRHLPVPFKDFVRPGETFGGYRYAELLDIATTRGRMDADELRV